MIGQGAFRRDRTFPTPTVCKLDKLTSRAFLLPALRCVTAVHNTRENTSAPSVDIAQHEPVFSPLRSNGLEQTKPPEAPVRAGPEKNRNAVRGGGTDNAASS